MITRDAVIGLVCLLVSLGLLVMTRGLPQSTLVPIGPAFYPRILFTVSALLSAMLLGSGLRRAERPASARVSHTLVLAAFATIIAYVLLLPVLGYRVATFVFVGGLQVVLEPAASRRWVLIGVVALATAVVTYYVFEVYLSVLLPRGRLTGS